VGFDAVFELVVDGAQVQIVFEGAEGGFDFGEMDVEVPEVGGFASAEVAAQQVAAFGLSRRTR